MKCRVCRGVRIEVTETHYRFWATAFGVAVPRGTTTMEALAASGMPEGLADLATSFAEDAGGLLG